MHHGGIFQALVTEDNLDSEAFARGHHLLGRLGLKPFLFKATCCVCGCARPQVTETNVLYNPYES